MAERPRGGRLLLRLASPRPSFPSTLAEQVTLVHPPRHGARRGLQAPFPRRTGRVHGQKQLKTGWIGDGRDEVPPPCRPEGARAAATWPCMIARAFLPTRTVTVEAVDTHRCPEPVDTVQFRALCTSPEALSPTLCNNCKMGHQTCCICVWGGSRWRATVHDGRMSH